MQRALHIRTAILQLPRWAKRSLAMGVDLVLCALAVWLALYLRLGEWVALEGPVLIAIAGAVALALPIFAWAGLYRTLFRFAEASSARVVRALLYYGVCYAAVFTFVQIDNVPRTVGMIQPILLFLAVAGSRILASWALDGSYLRNARDKTRQRNVMIYGAGSAGRQLFRGLTDTDMRVVGFVDDDERLQGQLMFNRPVYSPQRLDALVKRFNLADILLAMPSATRQRRHEILESIRPLKVGVRTLPSLADLAQGRIKASELRELSIEDLLGRDPVPPDEHLLGHTVRGKSVLVTGAGGSIGSELCRQVLAMHPSHLLLFETSEASLYTIHQELSSQRNQSTGCEIVPLLGSVCDKDRVEGIISAWQPETIYHAAAYKHVPLVEHNPAEGIWNNAFGTMMLAQAAIAAGVADFVLISTDKAVRPTNVMGASKRLAELILQALAAQKHATRLSMVRFGNVLGSSGSVVPLFRAQISAGGPLTITHPDIIRYFMTIREAAQLVLQAGAMADGGEVFVLDMGEPVKIVDLARAMIELSGLQVRDGETGEGDIDLEFVGLRPGEKLYEELLIGRDSQPTSHERILRANEPFRPWSELRAELDRLTLAIEKSDVGAIVQILGELVPDYVPQHGLVDWVHLRQERELRAAS